MFEVVSRGLKEKSTKKTLVLGEFLVFNINS